MELLERDYEELTNEGLLPFDFILMANRTYYASAILDHLVFIKLQDYAPQVAKLCVEFIECISATEEGRRVVRSVSDMIVVSRTG